MSQAPPAAPPSPGGLRPHRGVLILVLGILGIVLCFICGIVAWVMGNADLREMDAGTMDPEGRQLTQVGKILGMIGVGLTVIFGGLWLILVILGMLAGAASP